MKFRILTIVVAFLGLALAADAQGKLYFVGNGFQSDEIRRSTLTGTNSECVILGLTFPQDVTVDSAAAKVYWCDFGLIQRANLDGTDQETIVDVGTTTRGVALDTAGGKVYLTEFGFFGGSIARANLDGSSFEVLVTGLEVPCNIALDVAGGKMYWNDQNAKKVQRANLDGTNVEDLHTTFGGWGVAIDPVDQKLYYTPGSFFIMRSNLDGSDPETALNIPGSPNGLAIDPIARKIYWSANGPSRIQRANLDGTNVEVLHQGLDTPLGVALDLTACDAPGLPSFQQYGCGVNPAGSLLVTEGLPKVGNALTIELTNPLGTQAAGSFAFLFVALSPDPAFPCGTNVNGFGMAGPGADGAILFDLTTILATLNGPAWGGPGTVSTFNIVIPDNCALVGFSLFLQGVLLDVTPGAGVPIGLTGAVRIDMGS